MFSTYNSAKNRAKKLQQLLQNVGSSHSLHECQLIIAKAANFDSWHQMKARLDRASIIVNVENFRQKLQHRLTHLVGDVRAVAITASFQISTSSTQVRSKNLFSILEQKDSVCHPSLAKALFDVYPQTKFPMPPPVDFNSVFDLNEIFDWPSVSGKHHQGTVSIQGVCKETLESDFLWQTKQRWQQSWAAFSKVNFLEFDFSCPLNLLEEQSRGTLTSLDAELHSFAAQFAKGFCKQIGQEVPIGIWCRWGAGRSYFNHHVSDCHLAVLVDNNNGQHIIPGVTPKGWSWAKISYPENYFLLHHLLLAYLNHNSNALRSISYARHFAVLLNQKAPPLSKHVGDLVELGNPPVSNAQIRQGQRQ